MSMYNEAVRYINAGLAVFPLMYRDKRPLTTNGCKDATLDAAIVKAWWQKWPDANIGIATGDKSGGLFVVDLDIDEDKGLDGYHSFKDWQRENGEFPETCCSITGRGGYHLFFRSKEKIRNRAGIIDGVDVRGEGGYIVAPPSIHPNGRAYEWEQDIEEYEIVEADSIVLKFLETRNNKTQGISSEFTPPGVITDGTRNHTMFRFASSLQSKGLSDEAIRAAMYIENQNRCVPPLEETELELILSSVFRYEKGEIKEAARKFKQSSTSIIDLQRDDKGRVIQSIYNVCEILRNDEMLSGSIKYNTLAYSSFICGEVPWERTNTYREWSNSDDSNLKCYIEGMYGIKNMDKIMEGLTVVTNENKFNPVVDWLESLRWDGVNRIENLLPDYLGVAKDRYQFECLKLFMLGAINRAYRPGCKFDYMLVLTGPQGIGKSTFLKLLSCNDAWYNDNFNSVDGDKASEKLRGMWIVEFAELLAVKKAKEVESMKAFITSTVDTYRPPYGRRTEQRPRVCVFAGTTNSEHFLTDRTGNRRYLPIRVIEDNVKKNMWTSEPIETFQQAWAECMEIYRNENPSLVLPKDLEDHVDNIRDSYSEEDVKVGIIREWLDGCVHKVVCVAMVWEEALGNILSKPRRSESNEIFDILLSFKDLERIDKYTRCGKYGPQKCFRKIENFEESGDEVPF